MQEQQHDRQHILQTTSQIDTNNKATCDRNRGQHNAGRNEAGQPLSSLLAALTLCAPVRIVSEVG